MSSKRGARDQRSSKGPKGASPSDRGRPTRRRSILPIRTKEAASERGGRGEAEGGAQRASPRDRQRPTRHISSCEGRPKRPRVSETREPRRSRGRRAARVPARPAAADTSCFVMRRPPKEAASKRGERANASKGRRPRRRTIKLGRHATVPHGATDPGGRGVSA